LAQPTHPGKTRKSASAVVSGNAAGVIRMEVAFPDNRVLADVVGQHDEHLTLIENALHIEAVAHGNVVVLTGEADLCRRARTVLETLYDRAKRGQRPEAADIDGVIRHMLLRSQQIPALSSPEQIPAFGEIRTKKRTILARTPTQSDYIKALDAHDLTFATGPAGTGKTYLAVAYAAACFDRGEIKRIILSRPAVEAGERLGFLPGDMKEKVDPYLRPLYDALYDVLPADRVERHVGAQADRTDKTQGERFIEIAPLAFMRGRTLSNAIVILDEAQNCTPMQMKMFLTRLGEGSKMIVTGDPTQVDLPPGQTSGLADALAKLTGIDGIAHVAFTTSDVVRHPLVGRIIEAYERKG
jgi:phosphate starvation-inducible PhoH-like protein